MFTDTANRQLSAGIALFAAERVPFHGSKNAPFYLAGATMEKLLPMIAHIYLVGDLNDFTLNPHEGWPLATRSQPLFFCCGLAGARGSATSGAISFSSLQ
jgi:hypothetical protein